MKDYDKLLTDAPEHSSDEFLDYIRANNPVLYEDGEFVVIKNIKYGWPTAFAKSPTPRFTERFLELYGDYEWLKKPADKQTVKRFHIHLIHD